MISQCPFVRSRFKCYPTALQYLNSINAKLRADGVLAPNSNSLSNTMNLYELVGKPLDRIPTFHIGGTNGKGTTCFKLARALNSRGMKTGLFVSPHISSFRERIQVDSNLLPEDDFVNLLNKILEICNDHNIPATYFEITFIMSCLKFEQDKCDAVVLEVGVGGEWDATNVIKSALAVICSVGLDHTRFLGDTVEKIANVKAGIFKQHRPALIGPGVPYEVVKTVAERREAILSTLDECLERYSSMNYIPPLGSHPLTTSGEGAPGVSLPRDLDSDLLNSQLVLSSLCLLKDFFAAGGERDGHEEDTKFSGLDLCDPTLLDLIQSTRPPCRWEEIPIVIETDSDGQVRWSSELTTDIVSQQMEGSQQRVRVVLDIAHNPPAIKSLMDKVASRCPNMNVRVLCGMSRDKDVAECLRIISSVVPKSKIHFVQSSNFRAVPTSTLQKILGEVDGTQENNPHEASAALDESDPVGNIIRLLAMDAQDTNTPREEGVLVVCGSGYLMSQVRKALGVTEPNDEYDLSSI